MFIIIPNQCEYTAVTVYENVNIPTMCQVCILILKMHDDIMHKKTVK